MYIDIITPEHLRQFRQDLLKELKDIIEPNIVKEDKWIKSEDVKKVLKVSPGTLQQLRINRTLRFTKIGGIIYYDYEHIQKIMKDNAREPKGTDQINYQ